MKIIYSERKKYFFVHRCRYARSDRGERMCKAIKINIISFDRGNMSMKIYKVLYSEEEVRIYREWPVFFGYDCFELVSYSSERLHLAEYFVSVES